MGGTAVEDLDTEIADADAPGDLGLVEAFVNTVTYNWDEPAEERLPDAEALERWLADHGLIDPRDRITEAELQRAIALREALRELLHANHDDVAPPDDALALFEAESRSAPLAVAFGDGSHATLSPVGTGLERAIATLLAIVFHAMHDGTWQRLKACRNDGCRWAFYDASRNRSGRWCDMAVCGNRAKVRAYRERHG